MLQRETIVEKLTERLLPDPNVKALWLGGSLGRGTGDNYSDIDMYVAVAEADFEPFYNSVPRLVGDLLPILHLVEFAFRRTSPTERVWFIYVKGAPVFWRIDFHVHTEASARGADPDHRRELVQREFTIVKDPENLLMALPPVPAPTSAEYRAHVQERIDYFAMVFALMAGYVARGRFWEAVSYLASMQERMLYLAALAAEPGALGDGYPRRLKQVANPDLVQALADIRFDSDAPSQATAALALIAVFRRAAAQAGAIYPATFMDEVVQVYEEIRGGAVRHERQG